MKNMKTIITENKPLIGAVCTLYCWYGFCYLAGKGVSSILGDHFKKHPAGKGKVVVAATAATIGTTLLAKFFGDLVGESIGRNFVKETQKLNETKLEVIKNDLDAISGGDDADDFEVV